MDPFMLTRFVVAMVGQSDIKLVPGFWVSRSQVNSYCTHSTLTQPVVGEHRGPHLSVSPGVKNTRPPGYLYHSYSSGPTTVRFGESSIAHLGYNRLHNNPYICFCSVPVCQESVHNSHTCFTVVCLSAKNLVITATSASESCVLPRVCSQQSHLLQNQVSFCLLHNFACPGMALCG